MLDRMTQGRPDVPAALKRSVLVEAGHRCAIPTCRQTPVELAHIVQWVKVREHAFDNLIALCPTCHSRFDRGEIDKKSMLQYKENLDILNHRYTDLERQLLRVFVRRRQIRRGLHSIPKEWPHPDSITPDGLGRITIYAGMWWALANLLEDGMITFWGGPPSRFVQEPRRRVVPQKGEYWPVSLTRKGSQFVRRVAAGEPI